jgi:hypothetical protein
MKDLHRERYVQAKSFDYEGNLINIPINRDVLILQFSEECTDKEKRFVFRHELAHWIRWKKRSHSLIRMLLYDYFVPSLLWEEFIINWYLFRGPNRFKLSMAYAIGSALTKHSKDPIMRLLKHLLPTSKQLDQWAHDVQLK